MPDRARVARLSPGLRVLRDALLSASPAPPGVGARGRIIALAETTPSSFEGWWQASPGRTEGPVDVIDFFSGCGGMSAGFRAINGIAPAFRHILAADIDRTANRTYELNLGLKPVDGDVHAFATEPSSLDNALARTRRRKSAPLVLIGCAPCQGFSSHRNTASDADPRNQLFEDFASIALRLEPDFVVIENVPELCTDRHWPRVARVREMLSQAGYRTHLAAHNFAEFGLPQERFRVVMIASKRPFEAPSGFMTRARFHTVREAIGGLPIILPGEQDPTDPMHRTASHRKSTIDMIRRVPKNGGRRPLDAGPESLLALQKRQGKPGFEDVYGRLHWDRPAITITHYSRNPASGRFVHPEQDRGLSLREAALLQGFPRDYTMCGGFDDRFRQVGNAVPPVVAAHLALFLLSQLIDPPERGPEPGIQQPLAKSFARLIPALKASEDRKALRQHEATVNP